MKKYNTAIITVITALTGFSTFINGCMITLINDSNQTIILYDRNDLNNKNSTAPKIITSIATKKNHRFGSKNSHANFVVYKKQPKSKNFKLAYEVKQNACGSKGNPQIKLSDLENNSGDARLFTIKKNKEPHTSMVGRLPMIERPEIHKNEGSGCSSCAK